MTTRRRLWARWGALALAAVLTLAVPAAAAEPSRTAADIQDHWAQIPMEWARDKGILIGVSETALSPDQTTSRAMAVTALYRYQGSPVVEGESAFVDVSQDDDYADAVAWAVQAGIVTGKTETAFAPDDPVTRQEFFTMLYRWHVAERGTPETIGENTVLTLDSFADGDSLSPYAEDAAAWAVGDLLLTGSDKEDSRVLRPKAPITRGELAKILYQYDCAVLGNPGKLFAYETQGVEKIMVQSGNTGQRFYITDPAEIARFLEKVNAFTYTGQRIHLAGGGWYYRFEVFTEDGGEAQYGRTLSRSGVRISNGEVQIYYTGQDGYFAEDWLQSFRPAE